MSLRVQGHSSLTPQPLAVDELDGFDDAEKRVPGSDLEEVQKAVKHWKRDHPRMTITKEYRPVEFLYDGAHFLSKNKGSGVVIGALIVIDYEDPPN